MNQEYVSKHLEQLRKECFIDKRLSRYQVEEYDRMIAKYHFSGFSTFRHFQNMIHYYRILQEQDRKALKS